MDGAIKREIRRKTQINLVKSSLKHPARAHWQCYAEALSLHSNRYVSIAGLYYGHDVEAAKKFESTIVRRNTFVVFYGEEEVVRVVLDDDHYIYPCKQDVDLGAVCPISLLSNTSH